MKSLMKAMSVDCMRNISFMAFNFIHSLNSEIKEVMKVFRESEHLPSLSTVGKEPTRYVKITELAKNKKLQANIWEKVIMSTFYTLRNGTGQIILAKYS